MKKLGLLISDSYRKLKGLEPYFYTERWALDYLEISGPHSFKMVLAYSNYSKLVYDVTNDHMTLRFKIYWETSTSKKESGRFSKEYTQFSRTQGHYNSYVGTATPQALLLGGRPLVCIPVYIYIHKGRQALSVIVYICDLTEIGSPMLIRVNNDVTLGLTNDQWSTPLLHHY